MSKLKNNKAVKEFLQGTHRTQTRKTFGFSDVQSAAEKNKKREIGERWSETDFHGNVVYWEQLDGYRRRSSVPFDTLKILDSARNYGKSFYNCPKDKCTCTVPNRIDEIFRKKTGMCEDCVISMETKLKIGGKFKEYALEKMKKNANSFFNQTDAEVDILKKTLKNPISFVQNADGWEEKWTAENSDMVIGQIEEQYERYKKEVMEKFK